MGRFFVGVLFLLSASVFAASFSEILLSQRSCELVFTPHSKENVRIRRIQETITKNGSDHPENRHLLSPMDEIYLRIKEAEYSKKPEREIASLYHQRDLMNEVNSDMQNINAHPELKKYLEKRLGHSLSQTDINHLLKGILDSDMGKIEELYVEAMRGDTPESRELYAVLSDGRIKSPDQSVVESFRKLGSAPEGSRNKYLTGADLVFEMVQKYKKDRGDIEDKTFLPNLNPEILGQLFGGPPFKQGLMHEYPGYRALINDSNREIDRIKMMPEITPADKRAKAEALKNVEEEIYGRIMATAFHNGPGYAFDASGKPINVPMLDLHGNRLLDSKGQERTQLQKAGFWGMATSVFSPGPLRSKVAQVLEQPNLRSELLKRLGMSEEELQRLELESKQSLPEGYKPKDYYDRLGIKIDNVLSAGGHSVWGKIFEGTTWADEFGNPKYDNAVGTGVMHSGKDRLPFDGWQKFYWEMTSGGLPPFTAVKSLFLGRKPGTGEWGVTTFNDAAGAIASLGTNVPAYKPIADQSVSELNSLLLRLWGSPEEINKSSEVMVGDQKHNLLGSPNGALSFVVGPVGSQTPDLVEIRIKEKQADGRVQVRILKPEDSPQLVGQAINKVINDFVYKEGDAWGRGSP